MIRYGLGVLVAAGACVAAGVVACGDEIQDGKPNPAGTAGSTGAGGGPGVGGNNTAGGGPVGGAPAAGADKCVGQCCPDSAKCYSSAAGKDAPGAECLALRDNTGQDHVQMRQTWIRATTPAGNTIPLVYAVLSTRTQFPQWTDCFMSNGASGYMQAIDMFLGGTDTNTHYAMNGWAKFFPNAQIDATLADGLCYGVEDFRSAAKYQLAEADMSPSTAYPPGLPKPMAQQTAPWKVSPTKAKRVMTDFTLDDATRRGFLAKLDPTTGEWGTAAGGSHRGVFFYDPATGTSHGYGVISYLLVYDSADVHIVVPIREAETRSKYNDKDHPNCVGVFRSDVMDRAATPACESNLPTNPAWGCKGGTCPAGDGPATSKGYFLISELEQIFSSVLGVTLCVSYPTQAVAEAAGFWNAVDANCRSANWNPSNPTTGIPPGDWCSATNSEATADCHDAWLSESFHTFSAAKIKLEGANPATCPAGP